MAEDPVIPKLEDLKQAFIKSNKDEADRAAAREAVEQRELRKKIENLDSGQEKNLLSLQKQQDAVQKEIADEKRKGADADQKVINSLIKQGGDIKEQKKIQIKSNQEDLVRFRADLKFKENEIANRVPVSETQKQFEAARQAEERQKKYYESQGLRAEDNAKFRQDQFKRQKEELDFRIKNATSPSAREELEKERQQLLNKQTDGILGLKNAIVGGFKGLADKRVPGVGLSFGDIAKLALLPAFIAFLQSPVWEKIKAFLNDPSWTKFGEIIGEYPILISSLIAIVTGYGLKKIIDLFKTAKNVFMALKLFAMTTLPNAVKATYGGAKGFVIKALSFTKAAFTAMKVFLMTTLPTAIGKVYGGATGFLMKALELTKAAFTAMKVFLMTTLPTAIGKTYGGATGFLMKAVGLLGVAFTGLKVFLTATLVPAITAIAAPFLPVIAIVAAVVAGAVAAFHSIKEGIDEFKASLDQGDSLLEAIIKGVTKALATLVTLPITLVKNFAAYLAEKLGFKGIAKKLKEFSFVDIVTEGLRNIFKVIKDTIFSAVEGIKNLGKKGFSFIKSLFGGGEESSTQVSSTGTVADNQPGGIVFEDGKVEQTKVSSGSKSKKLKTGGFLPAGKFALVGEEGPELVMTKGPSQVFSEQRTDALGAAALNKVMNGGGMGGGGNVVIAPNQVQNNTRQTVVRPLSIQDPIIDKMTSSLAI